MRAAVDNRPSKRMLSQVLDHDPNPDDINAFLGRLQEAWDARELALQGSTTDGSALSPEPIRTVFGAVAHQIGPFHGLKELTQGILSAVAAERHRVAKSNPTLQRGRPASQDKVARQSKQMQEQIRGWFQERLLFVKRRLTPSERQRLVHISRGLPQLHQWRESMEHISALFDRCCRRQTALGKLKKLRQWVTRFTWSGETFKKVCAPHLEKALTCLDDTLLPVTSNAVERGNRRHRKMPKSVSRVRSQVC